MGIVQNCYERLSVIAAEPIFNRVAAERRFGEFVDGIRKQPGTASHIDHPSNGPGPPFRRVEPDGVVGVVSDRGQPFADVKEFVARRSGGSSTWRS